MEEMEEMEEAEGMEEPATDDAVDSDELRPDGQIVQIPADAILSQAWIDYAMSVIIGRAIPDARDGLKPVHRRILFAMRDLGNVWNRPHKKSARIVGDVIGKYHPHGDTAVYDAMVRMAQPFAMLHPLVDGQGNFGSVDGDAAAAMRYTESRMTKLAGEYLADIERDTVDMRDNYDNTMKEPAVLPSRIPNLLVNGGSGIAVGLATNIPPHNLREVMDACVAVLDDPSIGTSGIMKLITGPDLPTGGVVYAENFEEIYDTGRGSFRIRGRVDIEDNHKRTLLVIREIPYEVRKEALVERIAALVTEEKIVGIHDVRDESNRDGIRVVIELKRGTVAEIVMNQLFKFTQLETSFGVNLCAISGGAPQVLSVKEALSVFLEHRREVVIRRSRHELAELKSKMHILSAVRKALDKLDATISAIRESKTKDDAVRALRSLLDVDTKQAEAILSMRLHKLTGMEREALTASIAECAERMAFLRSVLHSEDVLKKVIRDELLEVRNAYGVDRRTVVLDNVPKEISIEDLIEDEEVVITVSRHGYLKRTPVSAYREQKRAGKGTKSVSGKDDDFVVEMITGTSKKFLLFFTDRGRLFVKKAYEIPQGGRTSRGSHVNNILNLLEGEGIATILSSESLEADDVFLTFVTKSGKVKRSALSLYRNVNSSGIIALGIAEDDSIVDVVKVMEGQTLMLMSANGKCIRFPVADVRPMGRSAAGVIGMSLSKGDRVISATPMDKDEQSPVLTVTRRGMGKRTKASEYRIQSRGGKGLLNMKVTQKTGPVFRTVMVDDETQAVLLTSEDKMIRFRVGEIRDTGRVTSGVFLVRMETKGGEVVAFDILAE